MGYYVSILKADFVVPPENLDAAYRAACALNERNDLKSGGRWPKTHEGSGPNPDVWFAWMPWNYPEVCPDLKAVLKELGFWFDESDPHEGLRIAGYDSKMGSEQEFLEAIAPFVKPGSYIEWLGEEGARWRQDFDGTRVKERHARISWE